MLGPSNTGVMGSNSTSDMDDRLLVQYERRLPTFQKRGIFLRYGNESHSVEEDAEMVDHSPARRICL